MTNMSYCRWENTLDDLSDCYNELEMKGQSLIDELVEEYRIGYIGELEALCEMKGLIEHLSKAFSSIYLPNLDEIDKYKDDDE